MTDDIHPDTPLPQRLAAAVLLFYEPGPFTEYKRKLWHALTGSNQATTKTLADLARRVLHETPSRE